MTTLTMTSEYIIECNDVHKWYGNFHALKGINLTVKQGEVIVIIGPSGSGKSTFIRTINRLEEHQSGEIIVDDGRLPHLDEDEIRAKCAERASRIWARIK